MQEEKHIDREKFLGKWSANDVTAIFKDKNDKAVEKTLKSLESGEIKLEELLKSTKSIEQAAASIQLEFFESGEMAMSILQSMLPNLPMTMQINTTQTWKLDGDKLLTQTVLDKMEAKGTIHDGAQLTAEQKDALIQQIPEIEANTLEAVKENPQMNRLNTVSILYSSKQYFLTKSEESNFVLHERR